MRGPSRALENAAIRWLCDNASRYSPSPITTCCSDFGETGHDAKAKSAGRPHVQWGGLCERDLLQMARESLYWRHVAILCGFTLAKINAPWTYKKDLHLLDGTVLKEWPDEGQRGLIPPELWQVAVKYDAEKPVARLQKWRVL